MKKLLLIVFCFSLFLFSCGSKSDTTADGEKIIKVWSQASPDIAEGIITKQMIEKFNEKYKGQYKAEVEFIARGGASSGFDDKVNAAITANELPDVLHIDGPNVATFAENGIIVPIGDYYTQEELDSFDPSIIAQGTYKEQLWALGYGNSAVVLFYNKDIFEKAGITPANGFDDVWTWDNLYDALVKVKEYDPNILPLDMHLSEWTEWLIYGLLPFVQSADTQNKGVVSPDGLEVVGYLDSQATREAFKFIQKLVQEKLTSISPAQYVFNTGNAAMLLNGTWEIENLKKNYTNLNWGYMPYPRYPQGEIKGPMGSWTFGVTSSSKNPEIAAELIKILCSEEASLEMASQSGGLPVYKLSENDTSPYSEGGEYYLAMQQTLLYGTPRPITPVYQYLSYQFQAAIQAIISGQDVDKVVDDMTQKVEKELSVYRK